MSELGGIEFKNLYEEIKYHSDKVESIVTLAILSTGAFYGTICSLIFVKDSLMVARDDAQAGLATAIIIPGVFLVPMLFILPSIILVASHCNSIARVASYIQVFYEEQLYNEGVGWQKRIQALRDSHKAEVKTRGAREVRFLGRAITHILDGLSIFCIVVALSSIKAVSQILQSHNAACIGQSHGEMVAALPTTVVVGYCIVTVVLYALTWSLIRICRRAWETERFADYIESWRTLKSKGL